MPFPPDAPGTTRGKVEDGRLPVEVPARVWTGSGSGKPCDGYGQVISRSQVEYEFESGDARTIRLHPGCVSLLEAERRRRSSP